MDLSKDVVDLFQSCAAELFGVDSSFYVLHYKPEPGDSLKLAEHFFNAESLKPDVSKQLCDHLSKIIDELGLRGPEADAYRNLISAARKKQGGGKIPSILYDLYREMRFPFPPSSDDDREGEAKEWVPSDWRHLSDQVADNPVDPAPVIFQRIVEISLFASLIATIDEVMVVLQKVDRTILNPSAGMLTNELRKPFERSKSGRLYTAKITYGQEGQKGLVSLIAIIPKAQTPDRKVALFQLFKLAVMAAKPVDPKVGNEGSGRSTTFGGLKGIGDNLIGAALMRSCDQVLDKAWLENSLKGHKNILQLLYPNGSGFAEVKKQILEFSKEINELTPDVLERRLAEIFTTKTPESRNRRVRLADALEKTIGRRGQSEGRIWK